jgi:hypothetical protein
MCSVIRQIDVIASSNSFYVFWRRLILKIGRGFSSVQYFQIAFIFFGKKSFWKLVQQLLQFSIYNNRYKFFPTGQDLKELWLSKCTVFPQILEHATMYVTVNSQHAPFEKSKNRGQK